MNNTQAIHQTYKCVAIDNCGANATHLTTRIFAFARKYVHQGHISGQALCSGCSLWRDVCRATRIRDRTRSYYVARLFAKMKDSIGFYVEFIAEVEKNPTLYNHQLADHSNRRTTKLIWTRIGKKFNEKGKDCRLKWKSIRSAYIRSLNTKSKRGSAAGPSKEYYLAPFLQFLNPFTKSRFQEYNYRPIKQEGERHTVDSEHESQIEETSNNVPDLTFADEDSLRHEVPVASSSASSPHFSSYSIQPSKYRKQYMSEIEKCAVDYFTLKKKKLEDIQQPEAQQKDPCEMFLLSLVPHMTSMSQQQQLSFQRGVLELIENIKYPAAPT